MPSIHAIDWEDCVVDVHSVKISRNTLETMFRNCGPVKSVFHWRGQGEKPHIFFEYRFPAAADAARTLGLDRSDIQVIKISNNDMLKRKFRELAYGPISESDLRCRPMNAVMSSAASRSSRIHSGRNENGDNPARLPNKPADIVCYDRKRSSWSSNSGSHPGNWRLEKQDESCHTRVSTRNSLASSPPENSRHQNLTNRRDHNAVPESAVQYHNQPLSLLRVPYLGEIIKLDLDKLEKDPTGIIRILTAVQANQKFWMITAAHYKGQRNLNSARKLLEAGIDMAVGLGMETDTKPFWHLLAQINAEICKRDNVVSSPTEPPRTSTPQYRPGSGQESMPRRLVGSQNGTIEHPTQALASKTSCSNPSLLVSQNSPSKYQPTHVLPENPITTRPSASRTDSMNNIPTGPRGPTSQPIHLIGTQNKMCRLQTELGILQEKHTFAMADLSLVRAAKRKAEDDVREERSVRRKLEKELRAAEDALKRSMRMEDAALDQVKKEVQARRKAENLLTDLKAGKMWPSGSPSACHG